MYPDNWEVVYPAKKLKHIHHFSSVPECANNPGRVTINDLPSELIVNIIRHVTNSIIDSDYVGDPNEDGVDSSIRKDFPLYNSRSLLQLALCSRYFHQLVEPILYERFHYNAQAPTKGFLMFLVRILARPDLGRWVRVFHVDGTQGPGLGMVMDGNWYEFEGYTEDYKDCFKSDFDVCCFTAEDLKAARKKIAEVGTTAKECYEWAMDVEKGDLNAMIALILTLTPNLRVLDIDIWTHPDSEPPILTQILGQTGRLQRERQLGHPLAFWGLKKVVVRYYYDIHIDNIVHHLIPLLTIPSVETLCTIDQNAVIIGIHPSVETDVDEEKLGAALQGSNLELANMKKLSLSFTAIRPNSLFRLWRCCPNLKKLCYKDRFGHDYENWMELDEFKGINLMATASCLNPHLQDPAILNSGYVWNSIMDSSTKSLAPLNGLRRLETTWEIFICRGDMNEERKHFPSIESLVDAIPRSLEQLYILDGLRYSDLYHDIALAVIFELLRQKHCFPALKVLDFGWERRPHLDRSRTPDSLYHIGFTKEDYRKVVAQCQKAGLELILKTPSPKYIYYFVDDDGNRTTLGTNEVQHIVHYPYDDYERICNENGCDLETGRPHKSVEISGTDGNHMDG